MEKEIKIKSKEDYGEFKMIQKLKDSSQILRVHQEAKKNFYLFQKSNDSNFENLLSDIKTKITRKYQIDAKCTKEHNIKEKKIKRSNSTCLKNKGIEEKDENDKIINNINLNNNNQIKEKSNALNLKKLKGKIFLKKDDTITNERNGKRVKSPEKRYRCKSSLGIKDNLKKVELDEFDSKIIDCVQYIKKLPKYYNDIIAYKPKEKVIFKEKSKMNKTDAIDLNKEITELIGIKKECYNIDKFGYEIEKIRSKLRFKFDSPFKRNKNYDEKNQSKKENNTALKLQSSENNDIPKFFRRTRTSSFNIDPKFLFKGQEKDEHKFFAEMDDFIKKKNNKNLADLFDLKELKPPIYKEELFNNEKIYYKRHRANSL